MTDEPEKTVDEPNVPEEAPETKGGGESDELEALLNEFRSSEEEPREEAPKAKGPEQPTAETAPDLGFDPKEVKAFMEQAQQEKLEKELGGLVSSVKGENESLQDIPDTWVRGRLEYEAARDPGVRKAFAQRYTQPDKWKQIVSGLGKKVSKELGQRADSKLTADRDAAAASARNRSSAPPETPEISNADLSKMSDRQFEEYKRQLVQGA